MDNKTAEKEAALSKAEQLLEQRNEAIDEVVDLNRQLVGM